MFIEASSMKQKEKDAASSSVNTASVDSASDRASASAAPLLQVAVGAGEQLQKQAKESTAPLLQAAAEAGEHLQRLVLGAVRPDSDHAEGFNASEGKISTELRAAWKALGEDVLLRLQGVVDKAVQETRNRIENEMAAARLKLEEEREQGERESRLLWAEVSQARTELQQREAKLNTQLSQFQKEKDMMTSGSPDDVLELNVGGERDISVLRSTLCAIDGSTLATSFSGRWDDQCPKDSRGRFFIDYPSSLFMPLLDVMRERKLAGPGELPTCASSVPASLPEEQLSLFKKIVEPASSSGVPIHTPLRFVGFNNGSGEALDGMPEALRFSVDLPVTLQGLMLLGPRTESSAKYVGWMAVSRGETEVLRQDVNYTLESAQGVAGELTLEKPVAIEAGVEYDIVLAVSGPETTCGETKGSTNSVVADGVTFTFSSSPKDEAGTGLAEGVIPGLVFSHSRECL